MSRMLVSCLVGVASVLLGMVNGVLMLILAVSPVSIPHAVYDLPLVAAAVQICSSCALAVLVFLQLRRIDSLQKGTGNVIIAGLGVLLSVASAALVGAALGWAESAFVKNVKVLGSQVSTFLTITFILWGVSIFTQLLYYVILAWVLKSTLKTLPQRFSIDDAQNAPREMVNTSRPVKETSCNLNPFQERPASPPSSLSQSDGTSTLRSSFSTAQRPSSSKRGLILRQPSNIQQSRASSSDTLSGRPSQDEGFDTWDTSGVSLQIRETMLQTKNPMKGSGLEPIPGSRSPSPAKALEGPFFQSSPSITPPASPLPQPSISQPNSAPTSPVDRPPDLPNFSTMFPPPSPPPSGPPPATPRQHSFSRAGSRSGPVSRSGSVAVPRSRQGSRSRAPSEDHIHPLFRTSSPTPPPSASANTTVTAAPEGGQLINERMLKRMRSGSLPSNSSPLVRSESSPNVRAGKMPPSPRLDTMPVPLSPGSSGSRSDRPHQRKRSASFQSSIGL